jgi:uncharacterized protein (TIGR03083 family)
MSQLSPERYFAAIADNTEQLGLVVASHDLELPVPTCPDWNLGQLASHLGRTQRWVAETVGARAAQPPSIAELPDGTFPEVRAEQSRWLRAGAQRVVETIRDAGDDQVWAFAGTGPATFWARRMAHEALVHRVDGQLATGQEPAVDPVLAADAIDEWLDLLTERGFADAAAAAVPLPAGAVMHLHATDDGLGGAGEWLVRRHDGALVAEPGHGKGDVAISGPASDLLLMLLRRIQADAPDLTIYGDASMLAGWLDRTPF